MKNRILFFLLLFTICISIKTSAQENAYTIIYEADAEGKEVSGKLEKLLEYVQNGNPIRIGWVLKFKHPEKDDIIEMQHWADAGFITTLNGHVFGQIKSIYQQGPAPGDPPGVFLVNEKPDGWVAILGTTGIMRQKYTRDKEFIAMMKENGATEEEIQKQFKEMETMKVRTKWAALQVKD